MSLKPLAPWVASTWSVIRELATDDAYEKYLEHHAKAHTDGSPPMSRRDFYIQQQQSKWTGVKRCC
jgi:uncharacterized short protein YbdD (DUF466 family)